MNTQLKTKPISNLSYITVSLWLTDDIADHIFPNGLSSRIDPELISSIDKLNLGDIIEETPKKLNITLADIVNLELFNSFEYLELNNNDLFGMEIFSKSILDRLASCIKTRVYDFENKTAIRIILN